MSNLRAIKGRLRSIRKNQQILRAMKMVSAVKLRRAQALMHSSRPYAERLETAVQDFLGSMEEHERQHPLLLSRRPARILWIVLSTDRGLCGSLNNNLFRSVQQALSARSATGAEPSLLLIGRKAGDFFKRLQRVAAGFRIELAYPLAEAEADILSAQLCDRYRKGLVDEVEVFFAQCLSTLRQSPQRVKLLPVAPAPSAGRMQRKVRLLEPAPSTIADDLVPRYLSGRLRQILFEEQLSEHSARMMMMDQASKKAADMIDQIQLAYNKLRQSMITRELADITTGVEAMA